MATNFPTSLDSFTNPQPTDSVELVSHAAQHADANDAIEALQTKLGTDNSQDTNSIDYRVTTLENASVDTEAIQDIVAGVLTAGTHTNITVSYDDQNNKISLASTYGDEQAMDAIATALTAGNGISKSYDDSANTITISVDTTQIATQSYVTTAISNLINSAPGALDTLKEIADALGNDANFATTITNALALKAPLSSPALTGTPTAPTAVVDTNTTQIATTAFVQTALSNLGNSLPNSYVPVGDVGNPDGVASLDQYGHVPDTQLNINERIQDISAGMITGGSHTNITVSYDDVSGTLSFTGATGGGATLTQEQVQDFVAPLLNHSSHTNLTAIYDDANDKILLSVPANLTQEEVQDFVAPLFNHAYHTNITATYDDANNRVVLEAVPLTQEQVQDYVAPLLAHNGHINITASYNDSLNKIILTGQAGGGGGGGATDIGLIIALS